MWEKVIKVEIFALIGESGSGKSYKAILVAHKYNISYIIDDGLLIRKDKILAGHSAKKDKNRIQAIRTAIFEKPFHAHEVIGVIKKAKPAKILVIGTSIRMIDKIIKRLELSPPKKILKIEDISTEKEIEEAKSSRLKEGRHVIPLPGIEVQRKFPVNILESLEIFYKRRYSKRKIGERAIVRPPFSYFGKLYVSENAILDIIIYTLKDFKEVIKLGKSQIDIKEEGILINISLELKYGQNIPQIGKNIQKILKKELEYITGISVILINIFVYKLKF
ncbi:MAG: Asp23/Gls24 family envelope stress response protein [Candidatus Caldatribacteriota bacterium]|nr:Asp23/Gls24 family envelope stress response protein [Candidatus Caldatribacteriota bacterium]